MIKGTIIAELGSVHDGSFGNAMKAIELAAICGADIVKFQTHLAEAETQRDAPMPSYFKGEPRFEYFRRTAFTREQWRALKEHATKNSIGFLSSPFSLEAVDLLEEIGVDAYKIPSGEVTNTPLLRHVSETKKPVYLSSGMSNWAELDRAVEALGSGGPIVILQCTSEYPCRPEHVGLNVIGEMKSRYELPVGLSDHTTGFAAAIAAAALGAIAIEKHLTFSKQMYGSDAANSMEPQEFRQFCLALRECWSMVDHPVDKDDLTPYRDMKRIFEKSIITARDLPAGTVIARSDLAFKKPGDGIGAWQMHKVVGRRTRRAIAADTKLAESDLAEG